MAVGKSKTVSLPFSSVNTSVDSGSTPAPREPAEGNTQRTRHRSRKLASAIAAFAGTCLCAASPCDAQIQVNAYISIFGDNTVSVIDTKTNTIVGSPIPVGTGPLGVAVTPDGRFAYVTSSAGNTVSVIDQATNTVVGSPIPVGNYPLSLAVTPDAKFAYVVNNLGSTVSVINTTTNTVVGAPIPVGGDPQGIAVTPNGKFAYVANATDNNVLIINTTTNTVVGAPIPVGNAPIGVAITPDGKFAYVANASDNTVSVIDTATNTVVGAPIPVGSSFPTGVAVTPDGKFAYVTNNNGATVSVIDTATNTVVGAPIPVGITPVGVAVTPDGKFVYVANEVTNTVSVIDTTTNTVVGSIPVGNVPVSSFGGFIGPNIIVAAGGPLSVPNDAALTTLGFGQFVNFNGGTLNTTGGLVTSRTISLLAQGGIIDTNGFASTLSGTIIGTGGLTKLGAGTLTLSGANTFTGGLTINGGAIAAASDANLGNSSGGVAFGGGILQLLGNFNLAGTRAITLNSGGGTIDTNGYSTTVSQSIGGSGGLTKAGSGTLTLAAANTYTGGTTVSAGSLQLAAGASLATGSALTVNGGTFNLNGNIQTVGALSGTGGAIALGSGTLTAGDASNTALAATISGTGELVKQGSGILTLTGANTFTGGTILNAGGLFVNGSLASGVTMNGGTLGGSGTIGSLVANGGILAPGNSIGTLTVNGSFIQNDGSTYQVEINSAGQGDRINVSGTATINGGAVQVLAQPGTYSRKTTYTILNATGGVSGAYSNVTSNFAFLTPSLSYDANNVYLLLFQSSSAFASGAQTYNQRAVGTALDIANSTATGDFNTVLNALAALSTAQGPAALDAISGQPYSGLGTANVASSLSFMNMLGQQMSLARGGGGTSSRTALALACDLACDGEGAGPWSAWGGALGATGSVNGDGNSSTLTYNMGGFSAGVDYRLDPRFLLGLGIGYSSGNQWVNGFTGRSTSDSYNAAAYASFTQAGFYLDALAGYGYNDNQVQRTILIPGLQPRTASGRTGANQFTGQAEAGYKLGIYEPAAASLAPFARFQAVSVNQNAFSESGANSLDLNVAQQTTTSLRTVLGSQLDGAIDLGWREKLVLQFRLGWAHEYADVLRPVTASFAGAPTIGYTVYGASQQRDSAIIGLAANTAIAPATSIYLRYDGDIGGSSDSHVLSAGLRMTW